MIDWPGAMSRYKDRAQRPRCKSSKKKLSPNDEFRANGKFFPHREKKGIKLFTLSLFTFITFLVHDLG